MQLTDTVKFLQKVALIHQGKVLILKRSEQSDSRPGAWDLPGGNAEWPESAQSLENLHRRDMAREIKEETALEIIPDQFSDENLVHFLTFFEADKQRYSIGCGWLVILSEDFDPGSIALSDEHTEFAWISLDELNSYNFGEPVGTYIKKIIRNAFRKA